MTMKNKIMSSKLNTTTIKTILFAGLIMTLMVPMSAQNSFGQIPDAALIKLERAHELLTQKMANKDRNDIPLVLSYVDTGTNTLIVGIDSDAPLSKTAYLEKLKTDVGDVPVKILSGKFVRDACNTQSSNCSPLWGGIQVQSSSIIGDIGTLTLPAQTLSGKVGFIMSGHVAGNGITGQTIGQATTSRLVGTVVTNPSLSNRVSDSAFVEKLSSITTESKIWKSSSTFFTVTGKATSSTTNIGTPVQMQGIASGLKSGNIIGKGLTVFDSAGTLTSQVAATYTSAQGDSGAPIFSSGTSSVTFYGIHVGKFCIVEGGHPPCQNPLNAITVYSPWEGIKGELTLV
jgi:hypothetical protein